MRRGTQRLAVWMVVVCLAATSCAAAADQDSGRASAPGPRGEPLAVVVGGSSAALGVVSANSPTPTTAAARRDGLPPAITFRRTVDERSPLRVGFIGDSVAF